VSLAPMSMIGYGQNTRFESRSPRNNERMRGAS
jgi:hypothetical protein